MKYGKRLLSLILIGVLCFGLGFQSNASETKINKAKKEKQQLEKKKKTAEKEQKALEEKLKSIIADMEDTEDKISKKEAELEEKEEELMAAKVDENDQYEAMKKRIKFMYENGDSQFIEVLLESESIGDFLNKAEYITTISDYDRAKLSEFQAAIKDVEDQEAVIQAEYDELGLLQNILISKEAEVQELMEENSEVIEALSDEISDTTKKINTLVKEAEEAAAEAARKKQEANSGYSDNAGDSVVSGNGMFTHPCPGYRRISSYFGYREAPLAGASTNHKGVDFAAAQGTPIYAADSGTVVQAHYSGNAGNFIIINHGNGYSTYYMHCYQMYVKAGQKVTRGQNIGTVGTTGSSTGPHLNFQVMKNGTPVNPLSYL